MAEAYPIAMKIERFFDRHYHLKYNMSFSAMESLSLDEMLSMADSQCLDLWKNMKFDYPDMKGHPLLRQEIAKLHGVTADEVLEIIPIEGIFIAMHCLVRYIKTKHNIDNFHAVTIRPIYQSLRENLTTLGCEVTDWTIRNSEDKGWYFDLDDLKQQLKDTTKLLVVNFPHNPSGACLTAAQWEALIDICKAKSIFLFSDEMYRLTNLDGAIPLPSACSQYEESMSLSGLSKTFALPGLRLGWLCTRHAELLQMMQRFKDYTSICGNTPAEILGIIALRNKEKIVKRTIDICQTNLATYDEFFNQHQDLFEWRAPPTSTTGLLTLKGRLLEMGTGGATGFSEVLQSEAGIVLLPSSALNYEPDAYVRLGFGRNNAPEGLEKLKEFIKGHTK